MLASQRPTVSVVIPCYNQGHLLGAAVQSVLAQTCQPVELIVVDDGSRDQTPEVAAAFGDRVRLIRQPNAGLAAARNAGLARAAGDLVNFLDADDALRPTMLERVLEAAARHPEAAVFYTAVERIDYHGSLLSEEPPRPLPADVFHELLKENLAPCHSVVVRRTALLEAGGFDPQWRACEDWDLWLRLAARGHRFVPVPEARTVYRRYEGSMSRDPIRMGRAAGAVLARHAQRHGFCPKCLEALRHGLQNCRRWYVYAAFPELGELELRHARLIWERSWQGRLRRAVKRALLAVPGLHRLVLALRRGAGREVVTR